MGSQVTGYSIEHPNLLLSERVDDAGAFTDEGEFERESRIAQRIDDPHVVCVGSPPQRSQTPTWFAPLLSAAASA